MSPDPPLLIDCTDSRDILHQVSDSLCLSLSDRDEPSHESRNASTSRQGTTGSCMLRIATREHAVQIEPSIHGTFSRNVAGGVTLHRSIPTSTREKADNDKGKQKNRREGTQPAMHPKPLSLCLCLCQTNLHMSRNASTSKQSCQRSICQQQRRLSSRSLPVPGLQHSQKTCLFEQQSSLSPAGSAIVRQHAGGTENSPPRCLQITQQLGALAAQSSISLEDQRSHGRTITLRFLRLPSKCSHSWFRRTFVATFCVRASYADVHPELLQDAREPGDHVERWRTASRVPPRFFPSPSRGAQGHGAPRPRNPLLAQ